MSRNRAGRRLRFPTIDARVIGGVVLVAISVAGGLSLTRGPEPATRIYVAASELDEGHILNRDDLRVAEVRGAPGVLDGRGRDRYDSGDLR